MSQAGPRPCPYPIDKEIRANRDSTPMGRSLVLCFDGTGNSFKNENTNIVHFFSALKKGDPQQLVYYQPGIGMYDNCGEARKHESNYDKAFGATVGRHIKDGYRFLMQEYQANDIISILGFSRGAYTARTLAAMVNTMGLLPAFNDEQIGFAFRIFTDSFKSDAYEKLAKSFRKTFSMPVQVHFVGCFDTVSSIGVVEHPIPTTHVDVEIKYFRHALSLDERRGKFREQRWIHRQSGTGNGGFHRGDGDNHQPHGVVAGIDLDSMKGLLTPYSTPTPPEASQVKEIWFAGCHSDVGGGYIEDSVYYCLSRIPLRWMIRQCFECDTGIIFNVHGLWEQGIREINSLIHPSREPMRHRDDVIRNIVSLFSNQGVNGILNPIDRPGIIVTDGSISEQDMEDALDARKPIHDELSSASPWWFLEFWPTYSIMESILGQVRVLNPNLGRYRMTNELHPRCHWTAMLREEMPDLNYRINVRHENQEEREFKWEHGD